MRPQTNSYGHSQMITPNIDNLASDGIQFNQAYVNIAVCGASRASILTGIRGSFTRFDSYTSRADTDLPDAITLPRLFKNNGYKTASIGKIYHLLPFHEKLLKSLLHDYIDFLHTEFFKHEKKFISPLINCSCEFW